MVQKKINDFSLAGSLSSSMQFETDIAGTTANKVNLSQIVSYVGNNISYFSQTAMIYVAKNGNDSTGNGTFMNPYVTIQKAINMAGSGSVIIVYPGTYTENLTINNLNNLTISGINDIQDSSNCILHGEITISGTTSRTKLVNLNIQGQTAGNPAIFDNGSQGTHFITNCSVNHTDANTLSLKVVDGANSINADISTFESVEFSGSPIASRNIYFTNCSSETITVSSVNMNFSAIRCGAIGPIIHTAGYVIVDLASLIIKGSTDSVTSTCALGSGLLFINNANLQQPDFSYGKINKTGTCPYYLSDINRSTSIDVLTGPRVNFGRFADDYAANITATNYTAANTSIAGHLSGINTRLGFSSTTASLNFGTVNANSTKDLTITVSGAASGNVVALGAPSVVDGISFTAFVSSANTVTVRAANVTTSNITLSSSNFTIKII